MQVEKRSKSKKPSFEPFKVQVTSRMLNMRDKPSFEGKILGLIIDEGVYTVSRYTIGGDSNSGWGFLLEKQAWVSLDYCKKI